MIGGRGGDIEAMALKDHGGAGHMGGFGDEHDRIIWRGVGGDGGGFARGVSGLIGADDPVRVDAKVDGELSEGVGAGAAKAHRGAADDEARLGEVAQNAHALDEADCGGGVELACDRALGAIGQSTAEDDDEFSLLNLGEVCEGRVVIFQRRQEQIARRAAAGQE